MPETQSPSPTATRAEVARKLAEHLQSMATAGPVLDDRATCICAAALLRDMAAAQDEMLALIRSVQDKVAHSMHRIMSEPYHDVSVAAGLSLANREMLAAIARAEAAP